jgi:hypothetical protein
MIINFSDLKVKATPAGNKGLGVSLVENDPTLPTPTSQQSVDINTASLNPTELKTVNDFIALCKSKL